MKNNIGDKIFELRKAKKLSALVMSEKIGCTIKMLSAIEDGMIVYPVEKDIFEKIALVLEVPLVAILGETTQWKIGIELSVWTTPLLLMMLEKQLPVGYKIIYQTPQATLLTGKELRDMLGNNKIDMMFIPRLNYTDCRDSYYATYRNGSKVGSILDTVKGGLKTLTVSLQGIKKESILLYCPSDTPADQFCTSGHYMPNLFGQCNSATNMHIEAVTITDTETFIRFFLQSIDKNIHQYDSITLFGYDPHISLLRTELEKHNTSNVQVTDLYAVTPYDDEFPHIAIDFVIHESKAKLLRNNDDFKSFLSELRASIGKINDLKKMKSEHYLFKTLAPLLGMESSALYNELYVMADFDLQTSV